MIPEECEKIVPRIQKALYLLSPDAPLSIVNKGRKACLLCLNSIRKVLHTRSSLNEKRKLINIIEHLECLKACFDLKVKKGGGVFKQPKHINRVKWIDVDQAFNSRIQTSVIANLVHKDILAFLDDAADLFVIEVGKTLREFKALKVNAVLIAYYTKIGKDTPEEKNFKTKNEDIYFTTDLKFWFTSNVRNPILTEMEEFQEKDSGWTLYSIVKLEINMNKLNPMKGSSYIELPKWIKDKKACINVKNMDNECFKWAILSAIHPIDKNQYKPNLVSSYQKYNEELDFSDIKFPVELKDVSKFEVQNNISVNVYGLIKKKKKFVVVPLHLTSRKKDNHVNILRIEEEYFDEESSDEDCGELELNRPSFNFHYVWIKDLSRLVSKQLSNKKVKKYICDRCLHYFASMEKLVAHTEDCARLNNYKVVLPKPDKNFIEFKNFKNREKVPFIIYADCESLLKPIEAEEVNKQKFNTEIFQRHEIFDIGYYLKCSYDDSLSFYESCPDEDVEPAKWFALELQRIARKCDEILLSRVPMQKLTSQQQKAFVEAITCHICEKPLHPPMKKVRDHCHLTGMYRGPAHEHCNLAYQDSHTIPVVFHNLSGYDAHFIIRDIATQFNGKVKVLALNKERYISFTKHVEGTQLKFRFIDSFRFMASSLEKLASYLTVYKIVKAVFSDIEREKVDLLTRKGVLPYEYLDSKDRLNETKLPPKEKFYSTLNDSSISDDDYAHAQQVWHTFKLKTIGEYVKLYMKTDVLLLADVFESFREQCLEAYRLDPAHYYTTPGFTWDAMLKYTGVRLELLTDIDMLLMIEQGKRGGVSQCSNRYAIANNKYMSVYNGNEEIIYITYFDANNLYGWAMGQPLPYGGFEWVSNIRNFDFSIPDDSPVGYILEVDLYYPPELHDEHNDMPFCPEHLKPPGSNQEKLLTTLLLKQKYVLHYRALKHALANGLKLIKIHRVLKFNQSTWLKGYIDLNTTLRTNARNEFEKNLFKLMNNAVYGKTMENVRKHVNVKLVTKWEGRYGAEALIAKPNFHSRAIFSENIVAIELRKVEVLFNKPIYVGLTVLDVSKILIYNFHYDYMRKKYRNNCKLLYTDTDSLIYEIKCDDIYADMKEDIHKFDTSDYPRDNVFGMPQANKKVLGLMKDECSGKIITEFVGLRSKMYSVRVNGEDFVKKVKGIKAGVVKKSISFDDYVECLRNYNIQTRTQYVIRSRLHNVETIKQSKIALSPYDDKRYLVSNSTDTLAWGHYRIMDVDRNEHDTVDDDDDDVLTDNDRELLDLLVQD